MNRLIPLLAGLTLLAVPAVASAHNQAAIVASTNRRPVVRIATPPILSLAEAQQAIHANAITIWNTPEVEASVDACHHLAHPWEVQCAVTWSDPSWTTTCGPLVVAGLETAVLEGGQVKVYAS